MARHERDGSLQHPYSALNLRLLLACFGLVCCVALTAVALLAGLTVLAWCAVGLGLLTIVDLVVIVTRLRARRRADPQAHPSLFE
jgi:predicted metal-binding membrane protein